MSVTIQTNNRNGNLRFSDDRRWDVDFADKEARIETVETRKGPGNCETDEWKAHDTDLFDYGQIKFDHNE